MRASLARREALVALAHITMNRNRKYGMMALTLLCVGVKIYAQFEYTFPTGAVISAQIRNYMPGLIGSDIGQKFAETIKDSVYTSCYQVNDDYRFTGANFAGARDLTVTIKNDRTWSGSVTASGGIKLVEISGNIGYASGTSTTGTYLMKMEWKTVVAADGSLVIEYSISIKDETRVGAIGTPFNIRHFQTPKPIEADERAALPTSGRLIGDYWQYNKWGGIFRPAFYEGGAFGSISGPIIVLDYW